MAGSSRGTRSSRGKRPTGADVERYVSRGSNRAFVIILLFLIIAVVFLVRLVYLQVIVAPEYTARAEESRTVGFTVEPRRGTIYDRNGHILAISVDATTVYANPASRDLAAADADFGYVGAGRGRISLYRSFHG